MKLIKVIFPLTLLGIGAAAGWYIGHPDTGNPSKLVDTHKLTITKKHNDVFSAPPGGYDPAFVKVDTVSREAVPDMIPLQGKLAFDAERLHLVSSRVAGRLDRIIVFEGAKVSQGQPLAELYSPDWISAQNEFLLARNTVRAFANASQKDLLDDAKATVQSARNRMKVLGASDGDIAQAEMTGNVSTHLTLRAPISGIVTKRNMDPGAFLNVGDNFMTVSDTSHIWFVGNIYEQDYARIKIGQTLDLQTPALPGKSFHGIVDFIGTNIDPITHTLPIRCTVENTDGTLRPELFVLASLTIGKRSVVVVPKSAIVTIKQTSYVILETSPGKYRRQQVAVNTLADGRIAVSVGLQGDERIVIEGGTLINESMSDQ